MVVVDLQFCFDLCIAVVCCGWACFGFCGVLAVGGVWCVCLLFGWLLLVLWLLLELLFSCFAFGVCLSLVLR